MEFSTKLITIAALIFGLQVEGVQVGRKTEGLIALKTPMKLGSGVRWTERSGDFTKTHLQGSKPVRTQKCVKDKARSATICISITKFGYSFDREQVYKVPPKKCPRGKTCVQSMAKSIQGNLQIMASGETSNYDWTTPFFSMFPKQAMKETFKKNINFNVTSAKSLWFRQLNYQANGYMNITTPKKVYRANIQASLPIKSKLGLVDGIYGTS